MNKIKASISLLRKYKSSANSFLRQNVIVDSNSMSGKPFVSILVPVCNVEKYLSRCLDSIVKQTLKNIEIIVINDGSTDSSPEIIKDYAVKDPRIVFIDKKNTGYGNSMNIGLERATGEYIGIVESDDFVADHMFESLYKLSFYKDRKKKKSDAITRIDVVKGNYFDYYEDGSNQHRAEPNQERASIPNSHMPFTLKEIGQISWGHPSVWSAIYRRGFLEDNGIRFVEEKGGGWVDNPFFYETLAKAKSIIWTNTPYYYYFRGNPGSSSNRQVDPSLPFKRMLENLDVLKKAGFTNGVAVKCAYARALMYLRGAIKDFDYDANETLISDYATQLMRKLDPKIIDLFNLSDQLEYHTYASPYFNLVAKKKKVLFYNWCPFDNPWKAGGGVTVYVKNLIEQIISSEDDSQLSIYMLSSGFAYDATRLDCFIRKIENCFGEKCRQYEIVNSPVPAEQRFIFRNPTVALENKLIKNEFALFLKKYGPFEVIHFNNIEGLSLDVFDLKKEFPETKFVFSIHNYVPFCLTGFYFMRHRHCVCNPNHTARDCELCAENGRMNDFVSEMYNRAKFAVPLEKCYSLGKWIKNFGLERLNKMATSDELVLFSKTAISKINSYCDSILAVSKRVYDIAVENGIQKSKMVVSYIGTKVADHQIGAPSKESIVKNLDLGAIKIVFLGNDINFEEKGYPFFINALRELDEKYASKIDLVLTVKQKEHYELNEAFSHFKSLKIINGYTHDDLSKILCGCDLSVVPVLWEDNLPQIAIESVAYGVPVLSSSAGGASELCDSDLFIFRSGDAEHFREKLIHFINSPMDLLEYWKHSRRLVTMKEHWEELRKIFSLKIDNSVVISADDYAWMLKEREFLSNQVKKEIINQEQINEVRRQLARAEDEIQRLKEGNLAYNRVEIDGNNEGAKKNLEKTKKEDHQNGMRGKYIFMTDNDGGKESANLLMITIPKFECSDFVADISFLLLRNISPSVSDQLTLSGTWLKDLNNSDVFYLKIHQIDWLKGNKGLKDWIDVKVDDNRVVIFGRHPGQFSGYSYVVNNLTSRAKVDRVEIEQNLTN